MTSPQEPLLPRPKAADLRHIPGSLKLPIIGDTFNFIQKPVELMKEKQGQYGNVFKLRIFGNTVVFLIGPEASKFLLVEQSKVFSAKEGWESISELFQDGLMLKDGSHHLHHRSIMQSAFRKEPLKGYMQDMIPKIEDFFESWQDKKSLKTFPEMKKLTLFLAGKVFFGLDFSEDLHKINQAIIQVVKASTALLPFKIPFTTYWYGMKGRKVLEKYFRDILRERRKNPSQDILGKLCEAENEEGDKLNDEEIISHLIFLLMAAHDTTASTLTSLFYELAAHPEWQAKLRAESQEFAAQEELSYENLGKLEQLDKVMKEVLRMHPPLIMIPRRASEDLEFEGYALPKGTPTTILIHHNHYEGAHFENPHRFDPDRFEKPRMEHKKCPYGYTPFGGGKHYCLGFSFAEMQIKLVMHHVLRHFRWEIEPGYKIEYRHIPIQEPKDGLLLNIQKLK